MLFVLHRRLVDSSSAESVGSSASRCHSCPHERVGVTAKRQKEYAFSTAEDYFSWRGMGLNVNAGAPVTGTYRVHPVGCEKNKARPVTHYQTVSETVRSYGSCIQRDTFWTVVHWTPAVVAKDQRVFPKGQPLSHDQGHAEVVVSSSSLHPGGPQYRSRHPVETKTEARGMEAPPQGGGADMEGVRSGTRGSVCISRDVSLSTLVLPHASSSFRTGRDGADVAEASSVCILPDRSASGSPRESSQGPGSTTYHCPTVAGQSMVPRYNIPSGRASSGAPRQEGPSVPSRGSIFHPNHNYRNCGLGL